MLTQDDIATLEVMAERFTDSGRKTLLDLAERIKPLIGQRPLTVWYGSMPESNGKSNFTAILRRKDGKGLEGMSNSHCIDRSEYPERVRYHADRVRYLLGELAEAPFILDYDDKKHSGYVAPPKPIEVLSQNLLRALTKLLENDCPLTGNPTHEQLIEFWEYEKTQGRGEADDQIFALNTVKQAKEIEE